MNNSPRIFGFAPHFSNVFGDLVKVHNGSVRADTSLKPDYHGVNCSIFSGVKRKRDAIGGVGAPKYAATFFACRGHSPSSSDNSKASSVICAFSPAKEIEDETSIDLGLNFYINHGNGRVSCTKPSAMAAPKAPAREPVCDLQLSLSMGPSQSVITNTSPVSAQASVTIGAASPVDDGATSSRRKPEASLLLDLNLMDANDTMSMKKAESQLVSTSGEMLKRPVTCSSGPTQQRNTNTKICKFQGCGKGARGASGLCIAHGGGRRCQREGCNKGAEGRTVYCKAHGGGRRCQFLGCTKSAEGRTEYCIAHGGGRRCSQEGCTKAARGKSGLCIRHGGGKRCQMENCTKSAEGHSGLCISHGGGRRCQFPACSKGAQGGTMFCKAHGGGKRCTALGCTKGAEGSTPFCKGHGGGKRCSFQGGGVCPKSVHGGTRFCVAHGGGKRCAAPECTKSARGRTNFCVRHGGGKRCKLEGCDKSAQGRTDFCKAHGGGKRCLWGQTASGIGVGEPQCDRFARGKTGLCATHSSLLPDRRVHGAGGTLEPAAAPHRCSEGSLKMKDGAPGDNVCHEGMESKKTVRWMGSCARAALPPSNLMSIAEGRVHGGRLMAMLAGGAQPQTGRPAPVNLTGPGAGCVRTHEWM